MRKFFKKGMTTVLLATTVFTVACAKTDPSPTNPSESGNSTPTTGSTETPTEAESTLPEKSPVSQGNDLKLDEYSLVWEDNFDAATLNRDDWNVELHEPGWVNAEWQEYVDSEENIFIEDGKLVIRPIKTVDADGNDYYTSGRVSTQNKQDFTYGIFEAKLKVPEGVGYLPAFWLMATDENVYGQWPRCGEIDIMEVHGSNPKTTYATLHYGNPHGQSQGSKTLSQGSFAEDFHTYTVEWNPGEIKWYVDGFLIHTETEWFSVTENQGKITYPAPFDQPFYMILNLAVGGSWVGYPDETTDFENARYEIDYVKVYQKESYDENVSPSEEEIIFRNPDENGNYIINGTFAEAEDLSDDTNWKFLLTQGGAAQATIENNQMNILVDASGSVDYSVQLVQPDLPMQKGGTYEITFDAYSTGNRTVLVGISAPDLNYIRYMPDTITELTAEKKTYTYTFTMEMDSDDNGRLEFNMGNVDSTEDIFIGNVSVKLLSLGEVTEDDTKSVLADGNYIYNGKFQEGEHRLGFWDIVNPANVSLSVTPFADGRRLLIDGGALTPEQALVLSQEDLALGKGAYFFRMDMEGEAGKIVTLSIGNEIIPIVLEEGKKTYSKTFTLDATTSKQFSMTFCEAGNYIIDNVSLTEDSLLKNGSFHAGLAGYEPYAYNTNHVSWVVDSLTEDNAISFTIKNTGDQAWHIQLKQNGICLEQGQSYRLSFDAKSNLTRDIMFAIQRDGSKHNDDWTPYSGEKIQEIGSEYSHLSLEFTMTENTDPESVFSLSMGAVSGTVITEQHTIFIDNIVLEKIDPISK